MQLRYHKSFQKQVLKLPAAQQQRLKSSLKIFILNPYYPSLYNHPLSGEWKGYRSIGFGGDWRAHYKILDKETVLFVAVGTHAQLYK